MGKVTVIKESNGERLDVDESSVDYLTKMGGYRVESADDFAGKTYADSAKREYDTVGGAITAFGEGAISGATLGLADPLMDDEATRFRAEFNPIAHGAGEIAGIVAPAVLSGGESLLASGARLTPAGAVARGAEALGSGLAKSRTAQLAVSGTLEGVGQATGGLIGSALAGDEVTPEAITHELGMGALFGLGGGIAARGIEMGVNKIRHVVTAADEKAAMSAVDDLIGEQAPRNALYDSPAAYQYSKSVKGAVADADRIVAKNLDQAAHEFEQWAGLADDLNAGIPDEAARTGPLRPAVGDKTANIKVGAATESLPVSESQVVSSVDGAGPGTAKLDFDYGAEVGAREEALAAARGPAPSRANYNWAEPVAPGSPTMRVRPEGNATARLGAADELSDLAAIKADGSTTGPLRTAKLNEPTVRIPKLDDVVKTAESAGTEELEDAARTLFDGRIPADNVFGKEVARKGKEIMGMIQARSALKDLPDLSLDGLSRMSLDEVTDVAKRLDVIGKYAPDVAAQLDGAMRDALGKAAPGLKDFEALDVLGYHKVSEAAVEKLAAVHDSAKNVVALWSTLKALDNQVGKSAGRSLAKEAMEAGTKAATAKGILTKSLVKRAVGKAVGAALGGAAAGPVGWVAGWAVADGLLGAKAAGGVAKTISAAKRKALLSTAKGLKALTGPGRPAAVAHMATRDKLAVPISLSDTTHEETRDPQSLVASRIEQATFAASSAGRERIADVLTPLRAKSPDLAAAMEADARRRAEYLARYAPRKPAWAAQMGANWVYPQDQVDRFASVYRAVTQPGSVLEDFGNGTLTPDAAAAWRETSPGMYKMVAQFVMEHFDPSEATYSESFNVSMLLGVPMHSTQHMVPSLQGDFQRQSPQGTSLGGGLGGTGVETQAQRATER